MAAIQNYRDLLLQAAPVRVHPVPLPPEIVEAIDATKGLSIFSTADQIKHTASDRAPSSVTFGVQLRLIEGVVSWSVVSGTAVLTVSSNSATIAAASISTDRVRVRAELTVDGVTYADEKDLSVIRDGVDGHDGSAGDAVDIVFRRSPAQPDTPAPSVSTPSEWFSDVSSVPPNAAPLWSCVGKKTGTSTSYIWSAPVQIEGTAGESGKSVAELTIYQRSASTPATPVGGAYNFGTATLTPPAGWSWSVPSGTSPVYVCKAVVAVTGTAGVATVGSWSSPVLAFQNGTNGTNGAAGAAGVRGTVRLAVSVAYATWDNTIANNQITVETGSSLRVVGDEVTQYSAPNGWAQTRKWNGAAWILLTQVIDGNLIVTGTITSDAIKGRKLEGVDIVASAKLTVGGTEMADCEAWFTETYARVMPSIGLSIGVEGAGGSSRMTFSGDSARVLTPKTELGLSEAGGGFFEYARFDAAGCLINTRSAAPALTITNAHGPALKFSAFSSLNASVHGNGCVAYHPTKGLVFTHGGVVHTVAVTGT